MTTWTEGPGASAGLARARSGRWVGGVCAGLAGVTGVSVAWIRVAFVLGGLLGGLGVALYLACWLIIPDEGGDAGRPGARGAVVLAQATAACAGLVVLAGLGAVATLFGFGWAVVGIAAVILAAVLLGRPGLGPAWALLPVAALTVPALAVAAGGLRLTTRAAAATVRPASAQAMADHIYRSGLNTMIVDLRHTRWPAAGSVPLRIDAGVRRTIVALPHSECVRVVIRYDVNPFAVQLGALLTGRPWVFSDAVVFGRLYSRSPETIAPPRARSGPVLDISFHSQGGSLYVRDYPDSVDPSIQPDWPGFHVYPEPRPDTRGTPHKAARRLIANWRVRRAAEEANAALINSLMPGPCAQ